MPCYCPPPSMKPDEYMEKMLCQACHFLSPLQLGSVNVSYEYIGLHQWYAEHLLSDINKSKDNQEKINEIIKEIERIGCKIDIHENGRYVLIYNGMKVHSF